MKSLFYQWEPIWKVRVVTKLEMGDCSCCMDFRKRKNGSILRHLQVPAIFIFPQCCFAAVFLQTWPKCVFASTAISILGSAWFSIQSWFCRSRASIFDAFLASAKSEHRVRKKERKKENIFEVRSKKKTAAEKVHLAKGERIPSNILIYRLSRFIHSENVS